VAESTRIGKSTVLNILRYILEEDINEDTFIAENN
jgi:hypothetical protein